MSSSPKKQMTKSKEFIIEEELEEENNSYVDYRPRNQIIDEKPLKHDLNKIMIPYDFENNRYFIKETDISFYENKSYVLKTLKEFEKNPLFNFEQKFNPKGHCKKFIFGFLPLAFAFLIYSYIVFFVAIYTFFNIGILYYCLIIGKNLVKYLKVIKLALYDKFKVSQIIKELRLINISEECIRNKIKWELGESGYYLTVERYI